MVMRSNPKSRSNIALNISLVIDVQANKQEEYKNLPSSRRCHYTLVAPN